VPLRRICIHTDPSREKVEPRRFMTVQWKGYGPEHDKWIKHPDVFTKDAINTYYCRYPNTLCQIASVTFDSLSFRRRDRTICFICWDTVFQGGVMSGEPPLQPLSLFWMLFHPLLWTLFRPPLRTLLCPSIHPPIHLGLPLSIRPLCLKCPEHLSAYAGT
jgi:hypothetical protein